MYARTFYLALASMFLVTVLATSPLARELVSGFIDGASFGLVRINF
jgi:hypothetical protein